MHTLGSPMDCEGPQTYLNNKGKPLCLDTEATQDSYCLQPESFNPIEVGETLWKSLELLLFGIQVISVTKADLIPK